MLVYQNTKRFLYVGITQTRRTKLFLICDRKKLVFLLKTDIFCYMFYHKYMLTFDLTLNFIKKNMNEIPISLKDRVA